MAANGLNHDTSLACWAYDRSCKNLNELSNKDGYNRSWSANAGPKHIDVGHEEATSFDKVDSLIIDVAVVVFTQKIPWANAARGAQTIVVQIKHEDDTKDKIQFVEAAGNKAISQKYFEGIDAQKLVKLSQCHKCWLKSKTPGKDGEVKADIVIAGNRFTFNENSAEGVINGVVADVALLLGDLASVVKVRPQNC